MTARAGVVLAGGHSRRFGRGDKALAELDGEPLLVRVVDRVSTVTEEVVVSCRPAQTASFERVLPTTAVDRVVEDRYDDAGPLAGIEAGFDAVSAPYAAVVACDMPFVEPSVVEALFEHARAAGGADAAVPGHRDGRLQPVQAVYRTAAVRDAVGGLLPDGGSLHDLVDALDAVTVPVASVPDRSLYNVNTRRDLAAAERRRGGR